LIGLDEVLAQLEPDDNGWAVDAPDSWGQGHTLYGGMTAALALEAAARSFPDLPALRSAQFLFVGPAEGRIHCAPKLLRKGRSTAFIGVDVTGDRGIAAQCGLAFGVARDSAVRIAPPATPDVPPPDGLPPLMVDVGQGPPGFLANFDPRRAGTSGPYSGGDPEYLAWTRFRIPPRQSIAAAVLALADAIPPAAMAIFPAPAPISTISWQIDLLDMPETLDDWFLLRVAAVEAADGYSAQDMQLWGADGRCIATARQLMAIFA